MTLKEAIGFLRDLMKNIISFNSRNIISGSYLRVMNFLVVESEITENIFSCSPLTTFHRLDVLKMHRSP